jgi:hypothetical protein
MAYFPLSSFPASQMMNLAAAAPATVPVAFKILSTVLIASPSFCGSDMSLEYRMIYVAGK